MNAFWKNNNDDYTSSAKVVEGSLILSLPDAINPIVWRMELGSAKASAFEVKPHANDSTFILSLKTLKGEVHDIAPFQNREQAVRALMRVTNAMQNAHGKSASFSAPSQTPTAVPNGLIPEKSGGSSVKWLISLAGMLLVIFLFAYMSSMTSRNADNQAGVNTTDSSDAESGVPQSADDVLRGQ